LILLNERFDKFEREQNVLIILPNPTDIMMMVMNFVDSIRSLTHWMNL
jgi:hypothetical protein